MYNNWPFYRVQITKNIDVILKQVTCTLEAVLNGYFNPLSLTFYRVEIHQKQELILVTNPPSQPLGLLKLF